MLANMWVRKLPINSNIFLTQFKRKVGTEGVTVININTNSYDEIKHHLTTNKIDILINCVGCTSVEKCEIDEKKASFLNSEIPKTLSFICSELKIKFIHISTDHLFDGTSSFYSELDKPKPLNIYAKSKYYGEKNVLDYNNNALIIRTNFFGIGPSYRPSFSDFIINSLMKNYKIKLFNDVFYTPILIDEFVRIITILLKMNISGIINISSDDRLTKYEFGVKIADIFGFNKQNIIEDKIENRNDLILRPKDMSLSNKKLKNNYGIKILPLDQQLIKLLKSFN